MPRRIPKYMRESPDRLPVDRSRLSEASLRSCYILEFYEDRKYNCIACGLACVFTAETQKEWCETLGRFYWERPNRCEDCHAEWRSIRKGIHRFPDILRGNPSPDELRQMQAAMERFKALGGRHNVALYNRILRFIDRAGPR